jgi:SPP1 family predicted phage head-tail adaptor
MHFNRPHRITIEARSTAQDSFGGQSPDWVPLGVFYANVKPMTGRELETAQAIHAEVTHEVRMLYDARVTAKHRIRFNGRLFDILSVLNMNERGIETRISAKEGLTQG